MANQEEIERLVGMAITDSAFRRELLSDPMAAAGSVGITLTPRQANMVLETNPGEFEALSFLTGHLAARAAGSTDFRIWREPLEMNPPDF